MTRRAFLGTVGLGAAAASASFLGACASSSELPPDLEDAHPLLGIATFDGEPIEPPALEGKVTLLDFWASWCAPCRHGFRYLDQLYRTFAGDGLYVLGVSVDDDPKAGLGFVAQLRPRFQVAWDAKGWVRSRFGVQGLPTTLLIDREVRLVHRQQGFDPASHRVLESHVRRLVRGL